MDGEIPAKIFIEDLFGFFGLFNVKNFKYRNGSRSSSSVLKQLLSVVSERNGGVKLEERVEVTGVRKVN